ncbi:cold-regulated 413 inner membrane protein 1, chloroplastic isoform X2 [Elaeis guineensis]|uniref:Cold-regulated 413 inner membrane protein 1, chloroplastic isoform X3 n=1 Tax=Elaeis guineensis var. tenera TaxID=51953 RepID=A0A6I9RDQ6_ELAGV|nr:cold-regulated 413 inner membrane protein 1, chloroplastic isoform X3 [Elaeis guineensis]
MSLVQLAFPSVSFATSIPPPELKPKNTNPTFSRLNGITTRSGRPDSLLRVVFPAWSSSRRQRRQCRGVVCYATPVSPQTLQWVSAVSAAVLMLAKGTTIQKSFLVPLFALQAPTSIISWIKGEYGTWTVFLALLLRLFYFIPGELVLPFLTMLLVIVAPYQAMNLRGTQAGTIMSLAIAGLLAFQHFSRIGSLRRAFDQGSIVATLAVICTFIVPCLFLL